MSADPSVHGCFDALMTGRGAFAAADAPVDVVLVDMPFGPLERPSLAQGLAAAILRRDGHRVASLSFTIPWAEHLGRDAYVEVANQQPQATDLLGEWVFGGALFGLDPAAESAYVDGILRRRDPFYAEHGSDTPAASDELIARAMTWRAEAPAFVAACAVAVARRHPRVVVCTSVFQQHVASLALARQLEALAPDAIVVIAGDNCEGVMGLETARQFPFVDATLVGEGDETLPALVHRVLAGEAWADLPGLATSRCADNPSPAPPVDLDRLPTPDFSDYVAQLAASPLAAQVTPQILFETSRGCWWGEKSHCCFCGLNGATLAFRSKSAGRALAELRELAEWHPGCSLIAVDNILDMRYFRDLIPALATSGLERELFYEVKSNLRREQLVALRRAGITHIQPGIESFSDQVLGLMGKGVTGLQNIQLLKWCKELGLRPYWSLLWGIPGEDPAAYAGMAELLARLAHLPPPDSSGAVRLDRFSPNFERAADLGLTNLRPYPAAFHVYPLAAEAVVNLAYSFAADELPPRAPAPHTAALAAACAAWSGQGAEADLFFADDGRRLLICDLRPMAQQVFTVVDGVGRELYLACDAIRGLGPLSYATGGDRLAAANLLAPLVAQGLLVQRGDSYLALAIPLGDYQPHPTVAKRAQAVAEQSLDPPLTATMATALAPALMADRAAAVPPARTLTGADGRGARSGRYPCVPAASSGVMNGSNLAFSMARK
jgi:ribosomal peptide maturation radical SAM protein 1